MSKQIEERVVKLSIDKSNFETNAKSSINILNKLKESLKLDGAGKGLTEADKSMSSFTKSITKNSSESISVLDKLRNAFSFKNSSTDLGSASKSFGSFAEAVNKNSAGVEGSLGALKGSIRTTSGDINSFAGSVNFNPLAEAIDGIGNKFNALSIAGITALQNIVNKAVDAGQQIVNSLTIEPVMQGFEEYELGINAAQVIMNSSGRTMEDVEKQLQNLNRYADKTIYKFSDMTTNMPKFLNAGLGLEESTEIMKGIFNTAGLYGLSTLQASNAMYNISQAYSTGYMDLLNWRSLENAGMATSELKKTFIETAEEMGTLTKTGEGTWQTLSGLEVTVNSLRDSLTKGKWLTNDVMTAAFSKYSNTSLELGRRAEIATTEVKTWTQLLDVAAEDVGSSWADTMKIIVGNYEEAKAMFSDASRALGAFLGHINDARNEVLRGWKKLGGRNDLINAISNIWNEFIKLYKTVESAVNSIFGKILPEHIKSITEGFKRLTESLSISEATVVKLHKIIEGAASAISILWEAIKTLSGVLEPLAKILWNFIDLGLNILVIISNAIKRVRQFVVQAEVFKVLAHNIFEFIKALKEFADQVIIKIFGKSLKDAALDAMYIVVGFVMTTIEAIQLLLGISFSDIFDGIKNGVLSFLTTRKSVKDYFVYICQVVSDVINWFSNAGLYIAQVFEKITGTTLSDLLDKVKIKVFNFFGIIRQIFSGIDSQSIFANLYLVIYSLKQAFESVVSFLKPIAVKIGLAFKRVAVSLHNGLSNLGIEDLADAINTIIHGEIAVAFGLFVKWLAELDKVSPLKIVKAIKEVLDNLSDVLEAEAFRKKAEAAMTFAKSIAILAGALFVLTLLDQEKVKQATAVVSVLFGLMAMSLKALGGLQSEATNLQLGKDSGLNLSGTITTQYLAIASVFVGMAAAIGILVGAIVVLSEYNFDDITNSIVVIGGFMILLGSIMKGLTSSMTSLIRQSGDFSTYQNSSASQLIGAAAAMVLLSLAVRQVAKAIIDVSTAANPDQLLAATASIVVILGVIGALFRFAFQTKSIESESFLGQSSGLMLPGPAELRRSHKKEVSQFGNIVSTLVAFSLFIAVFAHAMKVLTQAASADPEAFNKAIMATVAAISILCLSLIAITDVVANSSFTTSADAMTSFGKTLSKITAAMLMFSAAVAAIAIVGQLISPVDSSGGGTNGPMFLVISALVGFGILLAEVAIITKSLSKDIRAADTLDSLGAAILKIGFSFAIFGAGIAIIAKSTENADGATIAAIISTIVGFAGIVAIIGVIASKSTVNPATMVGLSNALLTVSAGMFIFAKAISALATVSKSAGPEHIAIAMAEIVGFIGLVTLLGLAATTGVINPALLGALAVSMLAIGAALALVGASAKMFAEAIDLLSKIPGDSIIGVFTALASGVVAVFSVIIGSEPIIQAGMIVIIRSIVVAIASSLPAIREIITTVFFEVLKLLVDLVAILLVEVGDLIIVILDWLVDFLWKLIPRLGPLVEVLVVLVITIVDAVAVAISDNADAIVSAVWKILKAIFDVILAFFGVDEETRSYFWEWFKTIPQVLWDFFENLGANLHKVVRKVTLGLWTFIKSFVSKLFDIAQLIYDVVIKPITGKDVDIKEKAKELMGSFAQGISDFINDPIEGMAKIGENIVTGLSNALSSGWATLEDAGFALGQAVSGGSKAALLISSPSKVFGEIGDNVVAGLKGGIQNGLSSISDTGAAIGDTLLGGVEGESITEKLRNKGKDAVDSFLEGVGLNINDSSGIDLNSIFDPTFSTTENNPLENVASNITDKMDFSGISDSLGGNLEESISEASSGVDYSPLSDSLTGGASEALDGAAFNVNFGDQSSYNNYSDALSSATNTSIANAAGNIDYSPFEEATRETKDYVNKVNSGFYGEMYDQDEARALRKQDRQQMLDSMRKAFTEASKSEDEAIRKHGISGLRKLETFEKQIREGFFDLSKDGQEAYKFNLNALIHTYNNTNRAVVKYNAALEEATIGNSTTTTKSLVDTFSDTTNVINDYAEKLKSGYFKTSEHASEWTHERTQMIKGIKSAFAEAAKSDDADIRQWGEQGLKKYEQFIAGYRTGLYDDTAEGLEAYNFNLNALIHTFNRTQKVVRETNAVTASEAKASASALSDMSESTSELGTSVNSAFGDETDSSGNIVKRYKVYINGQEASKDIQSLMELFKDNPTITPVVNLDEVTKGVAAANELFLANGWTKTYRIGAETANMTASLLGGEDHLNRDDINGLFTTLREIKEEVATLGDRIDAMDVILDSGAVVGGIAPQMDSALGQKAVQSGRERYSRY